MNINNSAWTLKSWSWLICLKPCLFFSWQSLAEPLTYWSTLGPWPVREISGSRAAGRTKGWPWWPGSPGRPDGNGEFITMVDGRLKSRHIVTGGNSVNQLIIHWFNWGGGHIAEFFKPSAPSLQVPQVPWDGDLFTVQLELVQLWFSRTLGFSGIGGQGADT